MLLSREMIHTIGFSLLHSLWQITIIALILLLFNKLYANARASIRYLSSFVALVLVLISFGISFAFISNSQHIQPIVDSPLSLAEPSNYDANNLTLINHAIENMVVLEQPLAMANKNNSLSSLYNLLSANLSYLVVFWLIGVLVLSLRLLGQYIFAERYKYRHKKLVYGSINDKFILLKENLKIKETVQLFESSIAQVPMVIGVFKPVVILPLSALSGLSGDMLEHILAHELAHIKRHDYLFNLIQTVIETLFFYHPMVWWISKQIRKERENACDDIAIAATGSAVDYAQALLRLEQIRHKPKVAIAATDNLKERIMRILNLKSTKQNPSGYLFSLLILFSVVSILGFQLFSPKAIAQDSADFKAKALIADYEFYWLYLNSPAKFDNKQELVSLAEDGVLVLEQKLCKPERKLEIRNTENGFVYEYFVDGKKSDYNELAKAWFADAIKSSLQDMNFARRKLVLEPETALTTQANIISTEVHSWSTRLTNPHRLGSTIFSNREDMRYGLLRLRSSGQKFPEERALIKNLADAYYAADYPNELPIRVPSLASFSESFLASYDITANIKNLLILVANKIQSESIRNEVLAKIAEKSIHDFPMAYTVVPIKRQRAQRNLFYRIFGNYAISRDAKTIKPTTSGAYIIIEDLDIADIKKMIIANHDGKISMRYFVNDIETPLSDDAYNWLYNANQKFIESNWGREIMASKDYIERTVLEPESISERKGNYQLYYLAQPIGDDISYKYLHLPSKTLKQLIEEEDAKFFSLQNKQSQVYALTASDEYSAFIKQTLLDAVDYYPINKATFEMMFNQLSTINNEDILAEVLLKLVPKLPRSEPELMQKFSAFVYGLNDASLKEQIQDRLARSE